MPFQDISITVCRDSIPTSIVTQSIALAHLLFIVVTGCLRKCSFHSSIACLLA